MATRKKKPDKPAKKAAPTQRRTPRPPDNPMDKVLQAIEASNGLMYLAAHELGVTIQTISAYALRWPEVKEAIRKAKGRRLDCAERKLDEAVDRGDVRAIMFFLERQGKKRGYAQRTEHRHGSDPKSPLPAATQHTLIPVDNLPLELRKQLLQALRGKNGTEPKTLNGEGEAHGEKVGGTNG